MKIQVYSIPGCTYCTKLKLLLNRASLPYIENVVGTDLTRERFNVLYPGVSSFPFVVIDGVGLGGVTNTAKFLVDKGLVSKRKK